MHASLFTPFLHQYSEHFNLLLSVTDKRKIDFLGSLLMTLFAGSWSADIFESTK